MTRSLPPLFVALPLLGKRFAKIAVGGASTMIFTAALRRRTLWVNPRKGNLMAIKYSLPVPHYLQDDCYSDTNVKCGAACAQMVLHHIDPGRAFTSGEQERLYDRINDVDPNSAWYSSPQGISGVLEQDKPAARLRVRGNVPLLRRDELIAPHPRVIQAIFGSGPVNPNTAYKFAVLGDFKSKNNPGIRREVSPQLQKAQIEWLSRLLIRTVAIRETAPIVAVREGNAHWIVVNGFQVQDDYKDTDPSQHGKIEAILIRNPLGRYTYCTITCDPLSDEKMKEITGHQCRWNPYVQDVVDYKTWVAEYMYSDWAETFVAVGDWPVKNTSQVLAHLPASVPEKLALSGAITEMVSRGFKVHEQKGQPKEITPAEAVVQAASALNKFNLSQHNVSVTRQNIREPVKVKRLDRIDGDYYLVPVGEENNKISAFINISITGEFNEATVWPNGHYIAPLDKHPEFESLTSRKGNSPLYGRKIRLTAGRPPQEITSVSLDGNTPFVWRPCPESFSSFRPFYNLKLTVEGRDTPISLYLPVDDHCLPDDPDDPGVISLPSANYLELLTDCIKQDAGNITQAVLVMINQFGNKALVKYQSSETDKNKIDAKLGEMKDIICQCLQDHPSAGLTQFHIKAYRTDSFLKSGGGDGVPLGTLPKPGGGDGDGLSCP
jgi:hypothetical protein